MPLTATLDGVVPLDSTRIKEDAWVELHDVRPRRDLRCRACGAPMHAKVSSAGLRFFAHDRQVAGCPSLGETAEHRQLKQMLAELIRDLGCTADIEATPTEDDEGGWRADVLGTSPAGTRVAFEVQLAAMTLEEGHRRTERYAVDGIGCVWISPRHAQWMTRIPSCRIVADGNHFVVDRGLARFEAGRWEPARAVQLPKIVAGLLKGTIVPVEVESLFETTDNRMIRTSPACLLVWANAASRYRENDERVRREQGAVDRGNHRAHRQALVERQERVLQHALRSLLATGIETSRVSLGVPPSTWSGTFPVDLSLAVGNEKTAQGAAIWVAQPGSIHLWAVVCPVAHLASPSLGASWRRRGVLVFVETDKEASRVSRAILWPSSAMLVGAPTSSTTLENEATSTVEDGATSPRLDR